MATFYGSYSNGYRLRLELWESATNPGNNSSTVRSQLFIEATSSYFQARANGSHSISGVTVWSISNQTINMPGLNSSVFLSDNSIEVGHNADGSGSASGYGYFATVDQSSGWKVPGISVSGSIGLSDFTRLPSAPASCTYSRSGQSVTVTAGNASSPLGVTYYVQYNRNGAGWTAQQTMSGQSYTYTGLDWGASYQFRVWAASSEGAGGFTYSGTLTMPTVPTAPTSITVASVSGLDVTVNYANSTSDGGEPITSYTMQYRTSADNGTTWGAWGNNTAVTGNTHTFTSLTPGLLYQFRVYSTNVVGNSATADSSTVFVAAGGRRWDGAQWQMTTILRRWNGTQWVNVSTSRRWDGTEWVTLT